MAKSKINWGTYIVELLVVIIGITIAFGIDKYAEQLKEEAEMDIALASIMDDLRGDYNRFSNRQIPLNEKKVRELDYILDGFRQEKLADDSLHLLISRMFASANSRVTNATYESLKSSGKLEDIPNVEVRRRIISHYQGNYPQSDFISDNNTNFSTKLADYVSSISPAFFTKDYSDMKLLTDPGFRSMVARWRGIVNFKVSEYKRLARVSKELLDFMEQELGVNAEKE